MTKKPSLYIFIDEDLLEHFTGNFLESLLNGIAVI